MTEKEIKDKDKYPYYIEINEPGTDLLSLMNENWKHGDFCQIYIHGVPVGIIYGRDNAMHLGVLVSEAENHIDRSDFLTEPYEIVHERKMQAAMALMTLEEAAEFQKRRDQISGKNK